MTGKPLRLYFVVGEISGDALGADLVDQFAELGIPVEVMGLGGEKLQARGLKPSEGPSLGEALVRPGDRIVVWGRAEEGLKQGGYRGAQETRIVALDDAEGPVLLEPAES